MTTFISTFNTNPRTPVMSRIRPIPAL